MEIRHFMNKTLCFFIGLVTCMLTVSCKEYTDDLQSLGKRVETLEQKNDWEFEVTRVKALLEIVTALQANDYVTKVTQDADGNYYLLLNSGETLVLPQGKDGKDGEGMDIELGVRKDSSDGIYYWTVNGEWMLDQDLEKVPACGVDGKDGEDGKSAAETGAAPPELRINPTTGNWEVSTDGGDTWTDTGNQANGKDGADGKDGSNGKDDIFVRMEKSTDGKSVTIYLSDGRKFTVALAEE